MRGSRLECWIVVLGLLSAGMMERGVRGEAGGTKEDAGNAQLFVKDEGTVVKYGKVTAKDEAAGLDAARALAKEAEGKAGTKLVEVATEHCLIFTNLGVKEQGYWKKRMEDIYGAVAKEFGVGAGEKFFPGRLPVLVFRLEPEFLKSAAEEKGTSGYGNRFSGFFISKEGEGYVSTRHLEVKAEDMKLGGDRPGRGLVLSMVEGFFARYRTNKALPAWVVAGMGSHIAQQIFPDEFLKTEVAQYLQQKQSIQAVFGKEMIDQLVLPVAGSMVEMLMERDRKGFGAFLNKLKDGDTPEGALKDCFKWDYAAMDKVWKGWALSKYGRWQ